MGPEVNYMLGALESTAQDLMWKSL